MTSPSRLLRIVSTDFLPCVCFASIYASTAAKSYILNYMWTAVNFVIEGRVRPYGRRLCIVVLSLPKFLKCQDPNYQGQVKLLIPTNIHRQVHCRPDDIKRMSGSTTSDRVISELRCTAVFHYVTNGIQS